MGQLSISISLIFVGIAIYCGCYILYNELKKIKEVLILKFQNEENERNG